jgi:phosphoserine aminotransferase
MARVYNFSPGPSVLAESVLRKAQKELPEYQSTGMSVMEMSHRSGMYMEIYSEAVKRITDLMAIPAQYKVLFLQGGATQQFSAVPLNMLRTGRADYIDSGNFAHLAAEEAKRYGDIHIAASSREDCYTYVPDWTRTNFSAAADYLHITTNNTIYGTRYTDLPRSSAPLVADMSSNILSEPYHVHDFGVIYAGAQKNIGPAGLCILIVREDLLSDAHPLCPQLLNWRVQAKNDSMYNTPNTFGIYMAMLGFEWLKEQGGVCGIEKQNIEKAALLYDCIDASALFKGTARKDCRSRMNVTFITGSEALDDQFVKEASKNGLVNLKGHRTVGGMRASIYNAMPAEGVEKLVNFMRQFEKENT